MRIVMFGDSITDMGRIREHNNNVYKHGQGYVFNVASDLAVKYPGKYEVINMGISGNRSCDLVDRLQSDVISLNPDVVSIFIGVNDVWHGLSDKSKGVSLTKYKENLIYMITKIKEANPDVRLMLMEPYFIDGETTRILNFEKVYKYARACKRIAKEYNIPFVKLQKDLTNAGLKYGGFNVCYDGVHPNLLGSKIIARNWLKTFEKEINK